MILRYFALLCMIVLVSTGCGKSAKAKCKEKYFAYKKDFPSVYDIEDTVSLNECLSRLDGVLACADSTDFEYDLLKMDRKYLVDKKPEIIYQTPRKYSIDQLTAYAKDLNLRLDSNVAYQHCFISTDYRVEDLVMDSVTLDGTIEYIENDYPRIKLELRFESEINGYTADFIELKQGMLTHRQDNFILVDFEGLSSFSNNPYDMLLGKAPEFTYGTLEPTFETNPFFATITAELPLYAIWGHEVQNRQITIRKEEVKEFEQLVDVFERMRTGRP